MISRWLNFAAGGTIAVASPLLAQTDVLHRYAKWEGHLRARVNEQLHYQEAASGASGDVLVAFRVAPDGEPADVTLQRSSGNWIFDTAAVRLVSHLGRVGAIPSAGGKIKQVVLKLSYGDGAKTASGIMQVAKRDHLDQLANERRDQAIISTATRVADNH